MVFAAIDAFVRRRLHEQGLTPSPPADARTLVRRLSFDLLGLPPDPEDLTRFVTSKLLRNKRFASSWWADKNYLLLRQQCFL